MIYFMQPTGGGPVKIGFTDDVDRRRRELETTYGQALILLGTREGGRSEETDIHDRFDHLRLGRTEQFRPDHELMAFIGRPLFVNASPVAAMPHRARTVRFPATGEWAAWIERASKYNRITIAAFLDRAAAEHAKSTGFDEPPPERIP